MFYIITEMKLHCVKKNPGPKHILNKRYDCNQIYKLSIYCLFW